MGVKESAKATVMNSRRHFIKLSGLAALGIKEETYAFDATKQPFIHGFNFKFKSHVPDEEIASLMQQLAALREKIPVLEAFFIGKNIARKTLGFQYGEIAVFNTKEDLMLYEKHPEHQELVQHILPRLDIGNGMDFFPIGEPDTKLGVMSYKDHFIHAFNFKFKDGVSDKEIAELMNELAGLKKKIPVLRELLVGKNEARLHRGFQYGQISVFERKEDLMAYNKHPEHQKLVRKIIPKLAAGNTMDFIPIGL